MTAELVAHLANPIHHHVHGLILVNLAFVVVVGDSARADEYGQ